ncbi:uncharacterized protein LOC131941896 [Physella acuta]|uniref:uncharacterized protein LOC131941896 n=1 Tax=Physella acuta TaxID=109671 RepID=UPI0027DCA4C7|nr:uncharacterized protein LOC131941896 [Physella acuta]
MADPETGSVAALAGLIASPVADSYTNLSEPLSQGIHYDVISVEADKSEEGTVSDLLVMENDDATEMYELDPNLAVAVTTDVKDNLNEVSDVYISREALSRLAEKSEDLQRSDVPLTQPSTKPRKKFLFKGKSDLVASQTIRPLAPRRTTKLYERGSMDTFSVSDNIYDQELDQTKINTDVEALQMYSLQGLDKETMKSPSESRETSDPHVFKEYECKTSMALHDVTKCMDELSTNCSPDKCESPVRKSLEGKLESTLVKDVISRDSSEDSGCFSNLSRQSTNLANSINSCDFDSAVFDAGHESADDSYSRHECDSAQHTSSGTCGQDMKDRGSGMCKNCWGRVKKDTVRLGTLDDFKAYAQSIAQSVKNILDIRPRLMKDETKSFDSTKVQDANKISNTDESSKRSLQRFKTDIHLGFLNESRAKMLLNRSVTCKPATMDSTLALQAPSDILDGTLSTCSALAISKGRDVGSPRMMSPCMDDEASMLLRNLELKKKKLNRIKAIKEESFNFVAKNNEEEKTKPVVPRTAKIQPRVERASTGSNLITKTQSPVITTKFSKKELVAAVSKSADGDAIKRSIKSAKDKQNAIKILRLQLLREGTPVDPPHSVEKRQDSKLKKSSLSRSATVSYKTSTTKKDPKPKLTKKEDSLLKVNRSSTKITIRTNKASALRKENSIKGKERLFPPGHASAESWKDEPGKVDIRHRSASDDGIMPLYHQRSDIKKSWSRSAVNENMIHSDFKSGIFKTGRSKTGDAVTTVVDDVKQTEYKTKSSGQKLPHSVLSDQLYSGQTLHNALKVNETTLEPPKYVDHPVPAPRTDKPVKTIPAAVPPDNSYCDGVKHLPVALERQLSSLSKTKLADTGNYYNEPAIDADIHEPKSSEATKVDALVVAKAELYTVENTKEDTYYETKDMALSKRDRSHESKSSTSFHVVANVRSSHSDLALIRPQSVCENYTSRRHGGETDVDTGFIYHFAKRQTTRAQVPNYHDLTSSKGIYTMSGDVSTSDSSYSSISGKSEPAENCYTGGFYKQDPFYDHDNNGDSSSASSSSHLYFEPTQLVCNKELSEQDLYTGDVFNSEQNDMFTKEVPYSNGSTNNSSRPVQSRMSRRYRGRPRIDYVVDSDLDIINGTTMALWGNNYSNNSSNGPDFGREWNYDEFSKGEVDSRPQITTSEDSAYTDYVNHRPAPLPVKQETSYQKTIDFTKYDMQETANTGFFFQASNKVDTEDMWYRGPRVRTYMGDPLERGIEACPNLHRLPPNDEDDSYTNIICPKYKNNNNEHELPVKEIKEEDNLIFNNHNNNHLEDFYTGDYEPQDVRRKPPLGVKEQSGGSHYSTSGFYMDSVMSPHPAGPRLFGQQGDSYASHGAYGSSDYSSPGMYGHLERANPRSLSSSPSRGDYADPPYASPSMYGAAPLDGRMSREADSWNVYEASQYKTPRQSDYEELPTQRYGREVRVQQEERDSYFDYTASRNPSAGFYGENNIAGAFSSFNAAVAPPAVPVVHEIKKVGGIVCRENVVNKEDYAEDVNRDLMDEPGAWVSYKYRAEEDTRNFKEMGGSRSTKHELFSPTETSATGKFKVSDDSPYATNEVHDNFGARNKWREMNDHAANKRDKDPKNKGSAKEKKNYLNGTAWRPSDQIPERAMGKRPQQTSNKLPITPTILEHNSNTSAAGSGNTTPKKKSNTRTM